MKKCCPSCGRMKDDFDMETKRKQNTAGKNQNVTKCLSCWNKANVFKINPK